MRSFRKGICISCAYLAIIIGIFVLQFRTDSTIIEKFGNLQVTLEKSDSEDSSDVLQNKFIATYNGLNFFADDQNSAKISLKEKNKVQNIVITNWEKREGKGFTFYFSNDVIVYFDISSEKDDATLSISASIPDSVDALYFPYSFARNMKIQRDDGNKVILNGKNLNWCFTTNQIKDGSIYFTKKDSVAHYTVYDDTKKFTFDNIITLAIADDITYQKTISNFKNSVLSNFKSSLADNNFTEMDAVAYVATMGEKGKYTQALEEIPSAYKKSDKRTYISSPFFNNLAKLNDTLDADIKSKEILISNAINNQSIDILKTQNIAAYLCIYPDRESIIQLLNSYTSINFDTISLDTVTNILKVYIDLYEYEKSLSEIIYPIINSCIEKITNSCSLDNDILSIRENDQFIPIIQGLDIATAILRYGKITGQSLYIKAGQAITNSYIAENTSFDMKTATTLYPILAYDNWYFPHFDIIKSDSNDLIWAWTCSKDIKYTQSAENGLVLSIDFPETQIHHIIFKGIPKFNNIYIYNLDYHTDPRFETYNSSGYVFIDNTYTLLLKSKQKSNVEQVRMTYANGVAPKKEIKKPARSTASNSNNSSNTASSSNSQNLVYSVILEKTDSDNKRDVVAAIREIRKDISGTEANNLFTSAPVVIKDNLTSAQADEIIQKLTKAGGKTTKKKK